MMNPESEETNSGEFKNDEKEEEKCGIVLVANVIEANKDGETVKYTIQTKEVCTFTNNDS